MTIFDRIGVMKCTLTPSRLTLCEPLGSGSYGLCTEWQRDVMYSCYLNQKWFILLPLVFLHGSKPLWTTSFLICRNRVRNTRKKMLSLIKQLYERVSACLSVQDVKFWFILLLFSTQLLWNCDWYGDRSLNIEYSSQLAGSYHLFVLWFTYLIVI